MRNMADDDLTKIARRSTSFSEFLKNVKNSEENDVERVVENKGKEFEIDELEGKLSEQCAGTSKSFGDYIEKMKIFRERLRQIAERE